MKVIIYIKKYATFIFFFIFLIFFSGYLIKTPFTYEILKQIYYFSKKEYSKYKFSECISNNFTYNFTEENFFIAGHTYGHSNHTNNGTYPKFLYALDKEISWIKTNEKNSLISAIILAGDVVRENKKKNFLEVKEKLEAFTDNLIVAPGNHDFGEKEKSEKNFLAIFKKKFQVFIHYENIFFILDSTSKIDNIDEIQIKFIQNNLLNKKKWNNIFIITHHIIWKDFIEFKQKKLKTKLDEKNKNFSKIYSMLNKDNIASNIFFISGDTGTHYKSKYNLYCFKENNNFFISTGMGNDKLDNFLKIQFFNQGKNLTIIPIFF